jgi:phosphoesterase RecJ-like protein
MEPDGDSVASQLALGSLLRRQGKQVFLYSPGPFDRPEIAPFAEGFLAAPVHPEHLGEGTAAVVLDCSTPDRLAGLAPCLASVPVLVIDHHAAGERFGDVAWIVPEAPAVAYLVQRLVQSLGWRVTKEEAELLLFGLARDTGFFRHLQEGSAPVFEAAARLVDWGASPQRVHRMMHSGWEPAKIRLLAQSLLRVELELGGRVAVSWQSLQDLTEAGGGSAALRGSEETYRLLQALRGVEVVAFLQEEAGGRCSVGLRSNQTVDVARLARSLGGGGHVRAAGYTRRGTLEQVRGELLQALGPLLA